MAIVTMADAVAQEVALSAEYNKVTANVRDLDARLGPVVSGNTAHARLTALEALTAGTRLTALETTVGSHTTSINSLNTAVGMPYGAGTSLAQRVTALENASGTSKSLIIARQTTAQNFATSTTYTKVEFQLTVENTGGWFDSTLDALVLTTLGWWRLSGLMSFGFNANNARAAKFQQDGVDVPSGANEQPAGSGTSLHALPLPTTYVEVTTANSLITMLAFQNSGVQLTTRNEDRLRPFMSAEWVGPS